MNLFEYWFRTSFNPLYVSVNYVKFDYHDNNFKEKCGREVETAMRQVLFVFHISLVHIERWTTVSWIICLSSFCYCAVLFFGSCVLYFHRFFHARSIVVCCIMCLPCCIALWDCVYVYQKVENPFLCLYGPFQSLAQCSSTPVPLVL